MTLTITTDHKWKQFKYRDDVPVKVLESQFSHLNTRGEDDTDGYFCYKGYWYHLSDFMAMDKNSPLKEAGWHGYLNDSMCSGVVLKVSDDCETYIVGWFVS